MDGDAGSVPYVRAYIRTYVCTYVCSPFVIALATSFIHISIGYDNISNIFAYQGDRVKVKVAVTIFRDKTTLSSH